MYRIFCDGSANLKLKKGGIGILISLYDENNQEVNCKEIAEGYDDVTNNQMELKAIIVALQNIDNKSDKVILVTDSEYSTKGILEWYSAWQANGKKYKNKELWDELMEEYKKFSDIEIIHTRGHGKGDSEFKDGNNLVDKLASYKNYMK